MYVYVYVIYLYLVSKSSILRPFMGLIPGLAFSLKIGMVDSKKKSGSQHFLPLFGHKSGKISLSGISHWTDKLIFSVTDTAVNVNLFERIKREEWLGWKSLQWKGFAHNRKCSKKQRTC